MHNIGVNSKRNKTNKFIKPNTFVCGDFRKIMQQIKPKSVDCIFTSPPYNIGKKYDLYNDHKKYRTYLSFLRKAWKLSRDCLKDDGRLIINVPSITCQRKNRPLYADVIRQCQELNYVMRADIVWHKQSISKRTAWGSWKSPSSPYVVQPYEFILVFQKSRDKFKHIGEKKDIDITKDEFINFSNALWNIKPETTLSRYHPAPFPYELAYRIIKFYTYRGDIILDMFGGTGTTALACAKNGRKFIYCDISKKYRDFAKKRIDNARK